MALPATIHRVSLSISDVERGVYETLEQRVARHPSESEEYLVTRLLAFALEFDQDLAFGRGVSSPDEPTLAVTDPTGLITRWIEVGAPSAEKLHKVAKRADDVAVYSHKDVPFLVAGWEQARIHRADAIRIYQVDAALVQALVASLARSFAWEVLRTDGTLFVTQDGTTHSGPLTRFSLA
jgi:uncharacterized protein YaeQ